MRLAATCVGWPSHRLDDLHAMIDSAINITARTFRERIGTEEWRRLSHMLGYDQCSSLSLSTDWAVSFHRSEIRGERVYFLQWSGIEHVFTTTGRLPNG